MQISYDPSASAVHADEADAEGYLEKNRTLIERVQEGYIWNDGRLGWFSVTGAFPPEESYKLRAEADRVRAIATVMIVIGIGGSNRGAMAAIQALHRSIASPTRIVFAGDTLSASSLLDSVEILKRESVVLNVIAKDFNTVEPGITFRVLRNALIDKYGEGYRERIIATGSRGPGQLAELSDAHGYRFLDFPADVGGRFSALTTVGLFPMAVAGIDIAALVAGAMDAEKELKNAGIESNPAVRYAVNRNLLFSRGFNVESLVFFEPDLLPFARWWTQLFAETEGKNQEAVFPTYFSYSEDLHAVGQYVQQGKRCIQETFLNFVHVHPDFLIGPSAAVKDGFGYLDGKAFDELNRAVYAAALRAHSEDGVPCAEISAPAIGAGSLGGLFYFFMFASYLSATLLGVNPFNQDGVENYKVNMYRILGKHA